MNRTYDLALLVVLYTGVLECGEGVAGVGERGRLLHPPLIVMGI
jgi:hypothetical protein